MKQQKGITLIALVITIIVLLILAGVTIAMLSGDNSTPGKASEASVKTKIAEGKEAASLWVVDKYADFMEYKYVTSPSYGQTFTAYLAGTGLATGAAPTVNATEFSYNSSTKKVTLTQAGENGAAVTGTVTDSGTISDWSE